MRHTQLADQKGFTIIELMIATSVLSVILVMVSVMMIGVGKLYNKGINLSRVQGNVRAINSEISQQIQLSNATPHPGADDSSTQPSYTFKSLCIGPTRYSYVLNHQIGSTVVSPQLKHVLWRDKDDGTCKPRDLTSSSPSGDGTELIAPNSSLTAFDVQLQPSSYKVTVGVAYGDDGPEGLINFAGINSRCKGGTGDEYCATAYLSTDVVQRVPL